VLVMVQPRYIVIWFAIHTCSCCVVHTYDWCSVIRFTTHTYSCYAVHTFDWCSAIFVYDPHVQLLRGPHVQLQLRCLPYLGQVCPALAPLSKVWIAPGCSHYRALRARSLRSQLTFLCRMFIGLKRRHGGGGAAFEYKYNEAVVVASKSCWDLGQDTAFMLLTFLGKCFVRRWGEAPAPESS
jgi:hypothetical protein